MRKYKSILFITVLVLVAYFYSALTPIPTFHNLRIMGIMGLIQLIVSMWTWKWIDKSLISPYIVFLLSLYAFSFGQSLLYAFDIVSEQRDLLGYMGITIPQLFAAQSVTLVMLGAFHIGALISVRNGCESMAYVENVDYTRRIRTVGWILFAASVIPYFANTINNLILSLTMGYGALYDGFEDVGVSQFSRYVADYFIPSLICLFFGYRNNRKMKYFIFTLCILNILAILLTGGRTPAVVLTALLVILYQYGVKRISAKGAVLLAVSSFLFLTLLSVVSRFRSESSRTLQTYLQEDDYYDNGAVEAVAEMGGTMFCLVKTMEIVPEQESYRYGRSYLYSFTTVIPNLGFWSMHPARREANLGEWLTRKLRLNYGTGYSMCAEAYINFGHLGWAMMLLLGFVLGRIFSKADTALENGNIPLLIFSLIIFWFCVKLTRNSFVGFVRAFFYYALPVYILIRGRIGYSNGRRRVSGIIR